MCIRDSTITVPCEHVFLSIGQSIRWGSLLDGAKVELGRGGAAVADPLTYQTAQPDIFVGGDVYTGPKFAIDAIAAGKQGAESLHRFVHENASLTIGRNRRQFKELDKESLALESYDNGARQRDVYKRQGNRRELRHRFCHRGRHGEGGRDHRIQ